MTFNRVLQLCVYPAGIPSQPLPRGGVCPIPLVSERLGVRHTAVSGDWAVIPAPSLLTNHKVFLIKVDIMEMYLTGFLPVEESTLC